MRGRGGTRRWEGGYDWRPEGSDYISYRQIGYEDDIDQIIVFGGQKIEEEEDGIDI